MKIKIQEERMQELTKEQIQELQSQKTEEPTETLRVVYKNPPTLTLYTIIIDWNKKLCFINGIPLNELERI